MPGLDNRRLITPGNMFTETEKGGGGEKEKFLVLLENAANGGGGNRRGLNLHL